MAEQNINVNVTANTQQATQQVDAFGLALNRVNQQARRVFVELQEFSQRYQQRGFLGIQDQRTLEQGLRQWERMTQVIGLRTRGAAARLGELRMLHPSPAFGSSEAAQIGQAAGVLQRLQQHQQALGALQGTLGNVLGGPIPLGPLPAGPYTPWPYGRGRSPGGRFYGPGFAPGSMTGYPGWREALPDADPSYRPRYYGPGFGPFDLRGYQAPPVSRPVSQAQLAQQVASLFGFGAGGGLATSGLTAAQLAAQGASLLGGGGLPPGRPPIPPGLTMPSGPFSNWPGSWWQRTAGYTSMYAGQALSAGGAMAMQGGSALLGSIQRPARTVLGAAAGFGIYQTLTESMDLYRQRAQGIIDVGMRLDLNFQHVGATIDTLRSKYQVLAHDSIAAQLAMARIMGTGGAALLDPAVRAGTAYGVAAPQAAALAGTFARLTVPGAAPLSTVAALASMTRPGITPMATEELWEETARIAGVGGTAAARVPVAMSARWMGLISSLGERYNVPGAASQFFGQFAAGVNQAPDATTQAVRIRALRDLARRQGPMLRIGNEDVDLRTLTGLRIAMEQASQSPEILEQYRRTAGDLFGADPEQRELGFQALVGTGLGLTESRRLRRELERRGGFAGLGAGAGPQTQTQAEIEAERLRLRQMTPEFQQQARQALIEPRLERMGEPLVKASMELKDSLTRLTDMMIEGRLSWQGLTEALQATSGETKALVGALIALSSQSYLGMGLGLSMMAGGGIQQGNVVQGGVQTPYGHLQLLPRGTYPLLEPTKPGP